MKRAIKNRKNHHKMVLKNEKYPFCGIDLGWSQGLNLQTG